MTIRLSAVGDEKGQDIILKVDRSGITRLGGAISSGIFNYRLGYIVFAGPKPCSQKYSRHAGGLYGSQIYHDSSVWIHPSHFHMTSSNGNSGLPIVGDSAFSFRVSKGTDFSEPSAAQLMQISSLSWPQCF